VTEAGQRFLPHARSALTSIETAVAAARNAAGAIRLGYAWATNDHVAALVSLWERTNPDLEIIPVYDEQPLTALATGAVDLAITRTGAVANTRSVTLATEHRYAALPSTHRLSRRDHLAFAELAGETIALTRTGTTSLDLWPSDQQPSATLTASSVEDWLVHIATGHAVGVTVESIVQSRPHPNITYTPIHDTDPVEIRLVARRPATHPLAPDLIAAALPHRGAS